jgi:peptide/nickel transport system permease protein/oligopeptide transport system permease protein
MKKALSIAGGCLIAFGALQPWATGTLGALSLGSVKGGDDLGWIVAALGLAVILLAIGKPRLQTRTTSLLTIAIAIGCGAFAVYRMVDVQWVRSLLPHLQLEGFRAGVKLSAEAAQQAQIGVGYGLFVIMAGCLAALAGGLFKPPEEYPEEEGTPTADASADLGVALESLGQWQLAWRRFKRHKMALIGLGILSTIVAIALFGPIIAPYDPLYIPGATKQGGDAPSLQHLFGTDSAGRDVLSNIINGAHVSIEIGLFSSLIGGFIGIIVGSLAGAAGGLVDNILMRITDVFFAIPLLFLLLVAVVFFGQGSVLALIIIFGLLSWQLIARLVRAQFLSLREADFVEAARAVGVSELRITFRHILPNALGPVIVAMTLIMASNIVLEAFVSYLNFGIPPTEPTWGNALSNAKEGILDGNWWWAFFPGMAIALTVISVNFIGDGLHDALDPRSRL